MVNLDKWEEIKFEDIRKGDMIRRITTDKDGFRMDVRGKAAIHRDDCYSVERWLADTNNNWIIARKSFNSLTAIQTLYRRKKKTEPLPEKPGAVLVGYEKRSDGLKGLKVVFIRSFNLWVNQRTGDRLHTNSLNARYEGITVLSEGATL